MDSPWDDHDDDGRHQDAEWLKLSNHFTDAGYREGITVGKESALQEGFDAGFADVGAPIGRDLGVLRGMASVVAVLLSEGSVALPKISAGREQLVAEARDICAQLSRIRFSDIMPPDLEAEAHAREHLEAKGEGLDMNEEVKDKKDIEALEDMFEKMGGDPSRPQSSRPTADNTKELANRLLALISSLGLGTGFD